MCVCWKGVRGVCVLERGGCVYGMGVRGGRSAFFCVLISSIFTQE